MGTERVRIKICGITRPGDARAAVRFGADAVGFVFAPSPRRVTPENARSLAEAARDEAGLRGRAVDVWGLFVDEPADAVLGIARLVGLDVVQLHGDESGAYAEGLPGQRLAKAVRVRDARAADEVDRLWRTRQFEVILLDAYSASARGGTGTTFDWNIAERAARLARIALAGGLTTANVGEAVRRVRPFMVDVSSGVEAAPGRKDLALIESFVERVREADASADVR